MNMNVNGLHLAASVATIIAVAGIAKAYQFIRKRFFPRHKEKRIERLMEWSIKKDPAARQKALYAMGILSQPVIPRATWKRADPDVMARFLKVVLEAMNWHMLPAEVFAENPFVQVVVKELAKKNVAYREKFFVAMDEVLSLQLVMLVVAWLDSQEAVRFQIIHEKALRKEVTAGLRAMGISEEVAKAILAS